MTVLYLVRSLTIDGLTPSLINLAAVSVGSPLLKADHLYCLTHIYQFTLQKYELNIYIAKLTQIYSTVREQSFQSFWFLPLTVSALKLKDYGGRP